MTHLLIFTIGPVQSFIASARKTQDLFAGSAILSNLVAQAYAHLKTLIPFGNIELIFPHKLDAATVEATNPNRFAVVISNLEAHELDAAVKEVKKHVIEEAFTRKALEKIKLSNDAEKYAEQQLLTFPEIFWAALPLEDDLSNYQQKYKLLESYLGGIKNARRLDQIKVNNIIGETGRKCNVDGVHNVIVYRKARVKDKFLNDVDETNVQVEKKLSVATAALKILEPFEEPVWEISQGEGLSAISFYKRRYESKPHTYPSTAKIALLHILGNPEITNDLSFTAFDALVGSNGSLIDHSDEQLFYEENINESVLKKSGKLKKNITYEKALEEIRTAWKALANKAESLKLDRFTTKYYALLIFDGDKMGEWLSGENCKLGTDIKEYQQYLSKYLHKFAETARKILDQPMKGKTVYAAGEDFLGFVNLNSLLPVLKELRKQFDEIVSKPLVEKYTDPAKNHHFTFSAGIAIAHYKQPLPTVLEEARAAEKSAKDSGKNCFCISVMRHSGGTSRCIIPFGEKGEIDFTKLDALQQIIKELRKESFSNKFIHQLIWQMNDWGAIINRELFDVEAQRLIGRASNHKKEEKKEAVEKMDNRIAVLSDKASGAELTGQKMDNLFATLRIADFIERNQKGTN